MAPLSSSSPSLVLGGAALLAALSSAANVRAEVVASALREGIADAAPLLVPILLAPSSLGPEWSLEKNEPNDFRFILGWPFQIPIPLGSEPTLMHRVALAPEVALGARNKAVLRGRLGYRFGYSWFFAGLGVLGDKSAPFLSPELGLRYPPSRGDFDFGGALYLRSDVDPDGVVRLSAQLGWVML